MIFVQPTPSRELDEFNLAIARHELEHLRRPAFQWMETGFVPIPFDARRAADVQREIAALEARLGIAPARKRPSLYAACRALPIHADASANVSSSGAVWPSMRAYLTCLSVARP